ncbi:hypothetical protein Tco_0609342 [Tanacetum coccineum]
MHGCYGRNIELKRGENAMHILKCAAYFPFAVQESLMMQGSAAHIQKCAAYLENKTEEERTPPHLSYSTPQDRAGSMGSAWVGRYWEGQLLCFRVRVFRGSLAGMRVVELVVTVVCGDLHTLGECFVEMWLSLRYVILKWKSPDIVNVSNLSNDDTIISGRDYLGLKDTSSSDDEV